MATRRPTMRFGTTLGSRPLQQAASASVDNAASGQRQNDWNTAAAQQYQAMRQSQFANQDQIDLTKTNTEANRQLLAQALGYDPKNSPPFSSLYTKFVSLPRNVQIGLYKQGAVPWLDNPDSSQTGEEKISEASKNLQTHLDSHTNAVVDEFTKGNLGYDKVDANGKPIWWQKVTVPNPNPMLPPTEQRIPANPAITTYLERAVNQGYMPNPVTGKFPEEAPLSVPKKQMSTDAFMQVLAARDGQSRDEDTFQQVLNQRANPSASLLPTKSVTPPISASTDAQSDMSLTPYNYGSNMSLSPYAYQNPLQFQKPTVTPSSSVAADVNDPFVRAHNYLTNPQTVENLSDTVSNLAGIAKDTAQGSLSTFLNIPTVASNAALRLIGGSGGGQAGQLPLMQNQNAQPALDPIVAAIQAQKKKEQEDQRNSAFMDMVPF